jgi:uncharacterized protein YkwD
MRRCPRPVGISAILLGILLPVSEAAFNVREIRQIPPPESTAIERRLFDLANKERETRALPPLHSSDGLAGLARRHSSDLALSGALSHLSSSGLSLQDRLVRAGLFFTEGGENVARSETYVADFIHQSLMESSEHRENILNSSYDTVGIGVVEIKDGSYYITQDFIRAIEVLPGEAAKAWIAGRIQEWRSARSLPPLIFQEEAGRLAQEFAEARAGEKPTPPFPDSRRETHMFIIVTPALERLDERSLHVDSPDYDEGGLGVSFGRLKDYPGGAYCVAVALLPSNRYLSLTDRERDEVIRNAVNRIRQKVRLGGLEADEHLTKEAGRIATRVSRGSTSASLRLSGPLRGIVFAFQTSDLEQVPREIEEIVLAPNLVRIGVCAFFVRSKEMPEGEFLVVGVVE